MDADFAARFGHVVGRRPRALGVELGALDGVRSRFVVAIRFAKTHIAISLA